ncbi:MAG: hypothetical protein G8345_14345 [Magnetococcales bacterium]|nr:hypothetical protein [Magnetococcales bacterium]NGZ28056.1 hypothetical protein [Magnetococcales bacterium]
MARWLIILALLLTGGCGYHFPGEQAAYPSWVHNASLRVENQDSWENPSMARHLEYRLRKKLGVDSVSRNGREIVVTLLPRKDSVLTVKNTGLASRRQIILYANLSVKEGEQRVGPVLAPVEGRALFSESPGSSPMQSRIGSEDAESEAVDRLTEGIASVLAAIP